MKIVLLNFAKYIHRLNNKQAIVAYKLHSKISYYVIYLYYIYRVGILLLVYVLRTSINYTVQYIPAYNVVCNINIYKLTHTV